MMKPPDPHYRHRFPAELISHAVWLYHVFSLSFRDVELILAERGILVTHESIRLWCLNSVPTSPGGCVGDDRSPATPGILMRCLSASAACCTICGGGSAGRGAGHSGAGPAERRSCQALLQASIAWAAEQATTPRHGRPAQLWRRSASDPAGSPDKPLLEQSSGEFASTYPTTEAAGAEVQIRLPGTAVPVDARHDLRSLPATAPSHGRSQLSTRSQPRRSESDERRPLSTKQADIYWSPADCTLTTSHVLTWQCRLPSHSWRHRCHPTPKLQRHSRSRGTIRWPI